MQGAGQLVTRSPIQQLDRYLHLLALQVHLPGEQIPYPQRRHCGWHFAGALDPGVQRLLVWEHLSQESQCPTLLQRALHGQHILQDVLHRQPEEYLVSGHLWAGLEGQDQDAGLQGLCLLRPGGVPQQHRADPHQHDHSIPWTYHGNTPYHAALDMRHKDAPGSTQQREVTHQGHCAPCTPARVA
jgi:hypothetical protein